VLEGGGGAGAFGVLPSMTSPMGWKTAQDASREPASKSMDTRNMGAEVSPIIGAIAGQSTLLECSAMHAASARDVTSRCIRCLFDDRSSTRMRHGDIFIGCV
jgi:hypothetical protein